MTLNGVDLSSHNSAAQFATALVERDFAICKATEGVSYLNPTLAKFLVDWRAAVKPLGTYHFPHPANDPVAEADWYLSKADPLPGEVLVLDFEPYGQVSVEAQWATWIVAFLKRVEAGTGAACWIYLNNDMASRVKAVATAAEWAYIIARPLWKASYTAAVGSALGWPTVTCWQWTDTPLDQDIFYGDAALWRSLGVPEENMALTEADVDLILNRKFKKQPGNVDDTSLRGAAEWGDNQFVGIRARLDKLEAAIKALPVPPVPPTAAEIAEAVADEQYRRQES